ncbi:MAG: ester cyclase [Pseudomonadota bacterium]
MSKAEMLQNWYDEVWVEGDLTAIEKYFAPDTQAVGVIQNFQMGIDDFRDLVFAMRNMVDSLTVKVAKAVENGDWLAGLIQVNATVKDTGAPVEVFGQVMARVEGDKFVETYNQFDFIGFFEQTGQMPPDTLPICMTGHRLDMA